MGIKTIILFLEFCKEMIGHDLSLGSVGDIIFFWGLGSDWDIFRGGSGLEYQSSIHY